MVAGTNRGCLFPLEKRRCVTEASHGWPEERKARRKQLEPLVAPVCGASSLAFHQPKRPEGHGPPTPAEAEHAARSHRRQSRTPEGTQAPELTCGHGLGSTPADPHLCHRQRAALTQRRLAKTDASACQGAGGVTPRCAAHATETSAWRRACQRTRGRRRGAQPRGGTKTTSERTKERYGQQGRAKRANTAGAGRRNTELKGGTTKGIGVPTPPSSALPNPQLPRATVFHPLLDRSQNSLYDRSSTIGFSKNRLWFASMGREAPIRRHVLPKGGPGSGGTALACGPPPPMGQRPSRAKRSHFPHRRTQRRFQRPAPGAQGTGGHSTGGGREFG